MGEEGERCSTKDLLTEGGEQLKCPLTQTEENPQL